VFDTTPLRTLIARGARFALGAALAAAVTACAGAKQIQQPLPAFRATLLDGTAVTADDLRGKPALLNFFAPG
jgi:hypothetical protein